MIIVFVVIVIYITGGSILLIVFDIRIEFIDWDFEDVNMIPHFGSLVIPLILLL